MRKLDTGVWILGLAALLGGASAQARTIVQISAGGSTSCALFDDGKLKCWGANASGQLGLGDVNPRGDVPGEMGEALAFVNLGANARAALVANGPAHSCAILDTGAVKCWGLNTSGQLGLGDARIRGTTAASMGDALPAVQLGAGRRAVSLALGSAHTCALLDDASIKCWGLNDRGQLGQGDARNRGTAAADMGALAPVALGANRVATAIAASERSTCALLRGGDTICWGLNAFGQLGREHTIDQGALPGAIASLTPVNLGTGIRGNRLAMGENFACALTNVRKLKCFGQNGDGRLGTGDAMPRGNLPGTMGDSLPEITLEPAIPAREIACGKSGCCAILNLSGALKCWGANEEGQLGLEDKVARGVAPDQLGVSLPFVELGRLSRVTQVSLGLTHACVLLESGTVKCWGKNDFGQLGIGSRNSVGDLPASMGEALADVAL